MEYSWIYFLESKIFGALNILIYGIFMDILLKLQSLVHEIF